MGQLMGYLMLKLESAWRILPVQVLDLNDGLSFASTVDPTFETLRGVRDGSFTYQSLDLYQ